MTALSELHEANLRSSNPGVRWQAQMEDHLATVRERLTVVARLSVVDAHDADAARLHTAVAQAAATAALALSIANTGGDLEVAISALITEISSQ